MEITKIFSLLRKPKPAIAEIETALAALDPDAAEREVEKLEAQRRRLLVDGSDEDIAAIEQRIKESNRHCERVVAQRAELEQRLAALKAAGNEAARKANYAAAMEATKDAEAALKQYPQAARVILEILGKVASAETAIAAANADLPAGATALPSAEMAARGLPGSPKTLIAEEVVGERWYYVGQHGASAVVPEEHVPRITKRGNSWQVEIDRGLHGTSAYPVEKRLVRRLRYQDAQDSYVPTPLAASITLPGYLPGQVQIWGPFGATGWNYAIGVETELVSARVEESLQSLRARATDPRPEPRQSVETITEPVGDSTPAAAA